MTGKIEPRLPKGTIVGHMDCPSCQVLGRQNALPMTIGEKGKVFVYCKQVRGRGQHMKRRCGWRAYWGREASDVLIDSYQGDTANGNEIEAANDNESAPEFEIRDGDIVGNSEAGEHDRTGDAGDAGDGGDETDKGAGDAGERKPQPFDWF